MAEKEITADEALLWLAGLEEPAPTVPGIPVLDLRELCPQRGSYIYGKWHGTDASRCWSCYGRKWVPKQGEQALYQAMHRAGWSMAHYWRAGDESPTHNFLRPLAAKGSATFHGHDDNIYIAAYKAMQSAGY